MARKTVYNSIVTDEEYDKVNEDNKYIMDYFLEYMDGIGRADGTIANYRSDIRICFIWCLNHAKNKCFADFTKRDILMYQNWLKNELELSSSRIRRLKSSISSMSNFIETMMDDEYPNFRNIVHTVPAPEGQAVRAKTIFEDDEVEQLLEALVDAELIQEACCLALALYNGSRKAELTRYKVHYFDDENKIHGGSLYITPEEILTKGRGGKMLRKYTLAEPFDKYLNLWLDKRKELGIDNEYLFVTVRAGEWEQAQESTLDSWANTINNYTEKHFYWHACRHYFTTHLSQNNIPADVIKEIVGWESVDMVSLYDDTDISDELGKFFGEGGIKDVEKNSLF